MDNLPGRMCATTPSPRSVAPPKGKAKGRKVWDELELTGSDADVAAPSKFGRGEITGGAGRDGGEVGNRGPGADAHDGPSTGRALLKSSLRVKLEGSPVSIQTMVTHDMPPGSNRQNGGGTEWEAEKVGVGMESGDSWDGQSASLTGTRDADDATWVSGGRSTGTGASAGGTGVLTHVQSRKWSARPLWRHAHRQDGSPSAGHSMDESRELQVKMIEVGGQQKAGPTRETNVSHFASRSEDSATGRNRMKSALNGAATLLSSTHRPRQR